MTFNHHAPEVEALMHGKALKQGERFSETVVNLKSGHRITGDGKRILDPAELPQGGVPNGSYVALYEGGPMHGQTQTLPGEPSFLRYALWPQEMIIHPFGDKAIPFFGAPVVAIYGLERRELSPTLNLVARYVYRSDEASP
jgi:hypothetical protein